MGQVQWYGHKRDSIYELITYSNSIILPVATILQSNYFIEKTEKSGTSIKYAIGFDSRKLQPDAPRCCTEEDALWRHINDFRMVAVDSESVTCMQDS